jgi:hypothetical protein
MGQDFRGFLNRGQAVSQDWLCLASKITPDS